MRLLLSLVVVLVLASVISAAPIAVSTYSLLNGAHGSFDYRDFTYIPCGGVCDVTGSSLSGGTGKLTDGVSPALDWYQEGELTSWVGWDSTQGQPNPVVTFFFPGLATVDTVTVWASNSRTGGVALPGAIVIGGNSFPVLPDTGNTNPRALVFSGLNLTGNSLSVEFDQGPGFVWLMVGEVSFDGTLQGAVPEPATWALAGLALLGLHALRRR